MLHQYKKDHSDRLFEGYQGDTCLPAVGRGVVQDNNLKQLRYRGRKSYPSVAADKERVFTLSFIDWNYEAFPQTIWNSFKSDDRIENMLQP